jgi:hypothetical protein
MQYFNFFEKKCSVHVTVIYNIWIDQVGTAMCLGFMTHITVKSHFTCIDEATSSNMARSIAAWLLCENDFTLSERHLYCWKRQEAPLPLTKKRYTTDCTQNSLRSGKINQACEPEGCGNKPLIRCSWCKLKMCFEHAIDASHFCDSA